MVLLRSTPNEADEHEPAARMTGHFEGVYAEYVGFVWRCLRALGVPEAQLDDAAQDVFLVVYRRLSDFRGESSMRTWLYGIVRNVAANQRRTRRRKGGSEPLPAELPSHGATPDQHAQEQQAMQFVQAFAARLDDKKRDVFILALVEELTMPEVATTLAIPLNTAYSRLRSVRLEFQSALEMKRGGR
jgi:RNA polymerase sigma-70 factor (ECF subfamily)